MLTELSAKGNVPCPPNDSASEVCHLVLCLRIYLPKSMDPQGKQSPSEGMTGGARRLLGRGREDDAAGGNIELIFN